MPARVILKVVSGPIQGTDFVFDSHDTFLFGRHSSCHARLPQDKLVSRYHFLLEANPPDARIRDLGSRNGTYVNNVKRGGREKGETPEDASGRQFPEIDLKDNDSIRVGKTTINVRIETPATCGDCGAEIPDSEGTQVEWKQAATFCAACRSKQAPGHRPPTVLESVRCQQCGKDVSDEVCSDRQGDYLCEKCQDSVLDGEGGLHRLLQEAARDFDDPANVNIDGYILDRELGRGGMGVVRKALRKRDGQLVAVKIMLAKIAVSDRAQKTFLREVDIIRQLLHPSIVKLLQIGATGSVFFFVMEYCSGGSLDEFVIRQGGKLPCRMFAPIMFQILDALDYAHKQGIVHRDLKPQNILMDQCDGLWTAKVADFGLAKSFDSAGLSGMTTTGGHGGTYHFMPREQLTQFKYFRPVSDVWSVAATFYHALTGQYPRDFPLNRDQVEVVLHDDAVPIRQRDPDVPRARRKRDRSSVVARARKKISDGGRNEGRAQAGAGMKRRPHALRR